MRKCLTPKKLVINPERSKLQLHLVLHEGEDINGLYGFLPGNISLKYGAINLNVNGRHADLNSRDSNFISWSEPCLISFTVPRETYMVITFYKDNYQSTTSFRETPYHSTALYHDEGPNENLRIVKDFMIANYSQHITLKDMAAVVGLSTHHLVRSFKKAYGLPPCSFLRVIRCYDALEKLIFEEMKGIDIAFECGFCDQSHFIREAKVTFGLSPKKLVKLCEFESSPLPHGPLHRPSNQPQQPHTSPFYSLIS